MVAKTPAYVQMELLVADSSCSPSLQELVPPERIRCRVERFRYSKSDVWKEPSSSSYIMVVLPGDQTGDPEKPPQVFRPGYGDRICCEGILLLPEKPLVPGAFDYGKYLRRTGIDYLLRAKAVCMKNDAGKLPFSSAWLRKLLDVRDRLIHETVGKIQNASIRQMAVGILFGFRGGLSRETRESFLQSGTIHILSVSGTHVGIFGLWMLLLFRFLPYRCRWMPALAATGIYTICTGMHEPAVRAFVMYGVFLLVSAGLLRTNAWNTLCLAAVLILLWHPESFYTAGFQYSFLTVGVLLCTGKTAWKISSFLWDRPAAAYVPQRYVRRKTMSFQTRLWGKRIFCSLLFCAAAFIANTALGIFYQGFCPLGSVPANFVLIPLASWVF